MPAAQGSLAPFVIMPGCDMRIVGAFRNPVPRGVNWPALVVEAYAAPVTAVLLHSLWVFLRGRRLYNAEIGGAYFFNGSSLTFSHLVVLFGDCAVAAIPVFVVLIFLRKRTVHRWLAWATCVFLWTWFLFSNEVAIR